jgi:YegS/Rv2252/BmrU family lipid kinase
MTITVIANPKSGGGRTARRLPEICEKVKAALGPVQLRTTDAPGDATTLTRTSLKDGSTLIIAVGGDGTVNECVNGFFEGRTPVSPDAAFGMIMSGTGGDFRRTFDLGPDIDDYIDALTKGITRAIDLGCISYVNWEGQDETRLFDNISSFGLSGIVDRAVNNARVSKLFGGRFSFYWCTLTAMLGFKPQAVRIQVDEHFDEVLNINNAAICNGQYFGGGMWIAPMADPADGTFEVVVIKDATFGDMMKDTGSIYEGAHLDNPRIVTTRGKRVIATPVNQEDVLIDADGETPGKLPATFEILPQALSIRC